VRITAVDGPARFQIIKQAPPEMISAVCAEMEPDIQCDFCQRQATLLSVVHGLEINSRVTIVGCVWCVRMLATQMADTLHAKLRSLPEDKMIVCTCCQKPLWSLHDVMTVEAL